jgi:predicted phage terminase large subunit-like protein
MPFSQLSQRAWRAAQRKDLCSFIAGAFSHISPGTPYHHNWHIEAIAEHLNAVAQGEITRLIINLPPRHLKSICSSIAWPAFLLGQRPSTRIIAASHAHSLALTLSQDTRQLMRSAWYRQLFPNTQIAYGEDTSQKFLTTERGFRLASSVGSGLIGEGADIIIVDDPMNPMDAFQAGAREHVVRWFEHSLATRLNDKARGAIVLVMQRLHTDDLSGHLLRKGGWVHLTLPAIAPATQQLRMRKWQHIRHAGDILHPARENQETLGRIKEELGSTTFAAQYQQAPISTENGLLRRQWLVREPLPSALQTALAEGTTQPIQSWDTAIKAGIQHDASACLTFAFWEGRHWLLDIFAKRLEYPDLRRAVITQAERFLPSHILMEDAASGQMLLQDLRRETQLPLIPTRPNASKLVRAAAISPMLEAGRLVIPPALACAEDFILEVSSFPTAAHDDQLDALVHYLSWQHLRHVQPPATLRRL